MGEYARLINNGVTVNPRLRGFWRPVGNWYCEKLSRRLPPGEANRDALEFCERQHLSELNEQASGTFQQLVSNDAPKFREFAWQDLQDMIAKVYGVITRKCFVSVPFIYGGEKLYVPTDMTAFKDVVEEAFGIHALDHRVYPGILKVIPIRLDYGDQDAIRVRSELSRAFRNGLVEEAHTTYLYMTAIKALRNLYDGKFEEVQMQNGRTGTIKSGPTFVWYAQDIRKLPNFDLVPASKP